MPEVNKRRVLIMCRAEPTGNPRPRRIIELCLQMGMDVSVFSFTPRIINSDITYYRINTTGSSLVEKVLRRIYGISMSFLPVEEWQFIAESKLYRFREGYKEIISTRAFDLFIVSHLRSLITTDK
jgi:hypothetical protein